MGCAYRLDECEPITIGGPMELNELETKTFLFIELALGMASKNRTRFLDVLGKLRNAETSSDEVRSVIQFVSETENIPVSELLPTCKCKTKAERCC